MNISFISENALGHFQSAAGVVDSAATLATALGTAIPAGTSLLLISPQAQAIRWRDDGVNPTAAVGYPLAVGTELRYTGRNLPSLRFIGQVAGAVLNFAAYGQS